MTTKYVVALALVAAGAFGVLAYQRVTLPAATASATSPGGGGPPGGLGRGGFATGGRGSGRPPLLVDTAPVSRASVTQELAIVGNLIGALTVDVAPKVNGRLTRIELRLGDHVSRGQEVAWVEDEEIRQQVSQADAAFEVAGATVRQREADLLLTQSTRDRTRSLYERDLLAEQELDDSEARFQAATAQLDLARAQFNQAQARLEELRITLANTVLRSPMDGFVGRRHVDPGASVNPATPVLSLVDISFVRLVGNLVEKDLGRVTVGSPVRIDVDAYPEETFAGRVARIAPVLDPATRTATMEVEIPNPDARLRPGMYARVHLDVGQRTGVVVVPRESVVARDGARGVFVVAEPDEGRASARFARLMTGLEDAVHVEVLSGVAEGDAIVTTGAAGLQAGDLIVLPEGHREVRPGSSTGESRP